MKTAIALLLLAGATQAADVEDRETIRKTLTATSAAPEIVVDDVHGSIRVRAHSGSTVEATILRTARGRSPERLADAKQEVKLEITEKPGMIRFYVDGPFRCGDGHNCNKGRNYYGYEVAYDFELLVPQGSRLYLTTVNGGKVEATGTNGDFDIHNVNGSVELTDMGGTGNAGTVNGTVTASFTRLPQGPEKFSTVNGKIILSYPKGLAADAKLSTMHGEMFTDFPVVALAASPATTERSNGRFVYRSDRASHVRIGNGGPEITLSTINGDVEIRQR